MSTQNAPRNSPSTRLPLWLVGAFLVLSVSGGAAVADGINTNNALTPARGQTIFRTQLRITELSSDNTDFGVTRYVSPLLLAYGLHQRVALIAVVKAVAQVGFLPGASGRQKVREYGVGDGRIVAKVRVLTFDKPGKTIRVALLGGLEVPSYDAPFSSESFDPLGGFNVSFKNLERGLDIDAVYKINTADQADDVIAYNAAYTQTLMQGQSLDDSFWQLNAVAELNALSTTGRQHSLAVSPGLQIALAELIIEASYLAPVVRPKGPMPSASSTLVFGVRRFW